MMNCVMAVVAILGSNMPLSIFDNAMLQAYLRSLNSKHRTPHQLEQNRIIEVLIDCEMKELSCILSNCRAELREGFVSASADFWMDSRRKEQFGALVIDLVAEQYMVKGLGMYMFMSKETAKQLGGAIVERCSILHSLIQLYCFVSASTDFWTDSHRKEQFGALVIDLVAEQ